MTNRTLLEDVLMRETTVGYTNDEDMELAKAIVERLDEEEVKRFWEDGVSKMEGIGFSTWCEMVEDRGAKVVVTNHTLPIEDLRLKYIKLSVFPASPHSDPGLVFVTN